MFGVHFSPLCTGGFLLSPFFHETFDGTFQEEDERLEGL